MKKLPKLTIPLLALLTLCSCFGSSSKGTSSSADSTSNAAASATASFGEKVSKVPITPLPIGSADFSKPSAAKPGQVPFITIDREHPNKMEELAACDIDNNFGLNNAFMFEDLALNFVNSDVIDYSVLSKSDIMIFAKRLPPINDCEFLIYRVNRTNDAHPEFPLWALLMVDHEKVVLGSAIVAGGDCGENDSPRRFLFRIDANSTLTVKEYRGYTADDMVEGEEFDDPNRLFEISARQYKLSINGIDKIDPS